MQSGLSFQFGKLRQDAQNRWLKNSEVLFILKNHENLPIEEETPEKPTSGSLFLFDRRILKYFRKDGHMWRKKKDGRAVGEAHERLKVENVDALNCYYAHGEENRYFQRRIYWMLDHAYAHIVLVHYLEVSKGKFLPPTDSQQTEKQLSSRNGNSSANNIQFERVPSATSEMYDSYDTFCSPISGEANSLHVGKDVDTNWPNMFNISANSAPSLQQEGNKAFRDLEEQLSLDKYDDNVPVDILPVHTDEHENLEDSALLDGEIRNSFQKLQENLTPTIEYTGCDEGVNRKLKSHDRKISPSWNDMLECSSYLTELGAHGRAFNSMALAICSEPCTTNAAGAYHHGVGNEFKQGSGKFLPPTDSQQTQEQLSSRNGNSSVNNIQFQRVPSATSVVYDSYETFCSPISGEANSLHVGKDTDTNLPNMFNISANSDPSSQQVVNQALRDLEEQLSLDKYDDNVPVDILPVHTDEHENLEDSALLDSEIRNSFQKLQEILRPTIEYTGCDQGINGKLKSHDRKISPSWTDMLECSSYLTELGAHGRAFNSMALANGSKPCTTSAAGAYHHGIGNEFKHGSQISSQNIFDAQFKQLEQISWQHPGHAGNYAEHMADGGSINLKLSAARLFLLGLDSLGSPDSVVDLAAGELYNAPGKSFDGRNSNPVSVQKENGIDYMGDIDIYDRKNAYSSDLLGMYSDQDQHGSSIAAEPCLTVPHTLLFRIREILPEWSFSFERTKVIITGDFLCIPSECSWAVMFGEVQVPAEIIQEGVLRCQAPEHSSGKVALCITSGNKESCSEVRQFEFRSKSVTSSLETSHLVNATKNSEELSLLVKFVYVLLCRSDDLSVAKGADPRVTEYHRKLKAAEEQCFQSHEHQTEILPGTIDGILQELIKDKFQQWLLSKTNAKEDGSSLLSNEDQRIIHMISGLGYEWALKPILDAGVGINFRDANGMTALHWAARFGREKMAAALLAVGAFAGAVTDPTPQDPVGKTAGDIAAARGHNGLAGYLSEAYMTEYLVSIKGLAVVEDGKIVESISEKSASVKVGETEDEISLKDSLAAVRNAAQAAARIQAAFRAHSFKKRQEKDAMKRDEYGMTSEEIHCLASSTKIQRTRNSFHGQKFDKAALSIQNKYRGWKARKDFLAFRQRVVKIQAHVRGHQARMKYEILSTVSVLDKLILRWRRRGNGLRGFRLESDLADEGGEDIIKVFRKQKVDGTLEQAFSRVISTVKSPRSRQQYRRMLEYYCQVKAEEESAEEAIRVRDNFELMEDDEFLHWLQQDQFQDQRQLSSCWNHK